MPQQPHVSGSSQHSKASSHHSHSSRVSRAESLADQTAQARIDAAEAIAVLHVAKAERLEKEQMAMAQVRLEFLQHEWETARTAARVSALQAEAESTAFARNLEGLEIENLHYCVQAYIDDQSTPQPEQTGAPQLTTKLPRPSGQEGEYQ